MKAFTTRFKMADRNAEKCVVNHVTEFITKSRVSPEGPGTLLVHRKIAEGVFGLYKMS